MSQKYEKNKTIKLQEILILERKIWKASEAAQNRIEQKLS